MTPAGVRGWGQAAQELVERHRGATAATLDRLAAVLAEPQAAQWRACDELARAPGAALAFRGRV